LSNKAETQKYLQNCNLHLIKPKNNFNMMFKNKSEKVNSVKNYFIEDEKEKRLIIFQMKQKPSLKFSEIEKHLGFS